MASASLLSSLGAVRYRERAFAKLNLILHVGRPRADGLHPLCSLFTSIDLSDEIEARPAEGGEDRVDCVGVDGKNLALSALEIFRERSGLRLPPVSLRIGKRIPVASGLGGGSADAAAVLRIANEMAGGGRDAAGLRELATALGSDVPSQIEPGHAVVQGTGEDVDPVELPDFTAVLVPSDEGMSTGRVYAELDRLGGWRDGLDPEPLRRVAERSLSDPSVLAHHLENDLEPAALSLRPELEATLSRLRDAGALGVAVSGSGPTCFGLFAERAAGEETAAAIPSALAAEFRHAARAASAVPGG